MKGAVHTRYRPLEVVQIADIEKPVPKDSEVLIKVRAASVNPRDGGLLEGRPYSGRIMTGLRKPKVTRAGVDVAGRRASGFVLTHLGEITLPETLAEELR